MDAKLVLLLLVLGAVCLQAQPVKDPVTDSAESAESMEKRAAVTPASAESDEEMAPAKPQRRSVDDPMSDSMSDETEEVSWSGTRKRRQASSTAKLDESVESKETKESAESDEKPKAKRSAESDSDSDSDDSDSSSSEESAVAKRQAEKKDAKKPEEEVAKRATDESDESDEKDAKKPEEEVAKRATDESDESDEKDAKKPKDRKRRQAEDAMTAPVAATAENASSDDNSTQTLYLIKTVTYEVGVLGAAGDDNSSLTVATPSPVAEKEVVTIYYDEPNNATQATPAA